MSEHTPPNDLKDLQRFRSELLSRPDYVEDHQLWLKERVFVTYDNLLNMFAGESLNTGSFLDTGSADGAFVKVCQSHGLDGENLDADMGINFETDVFPFADGAFDYVNSNSVIEHLHNPDRYIQEISRVLKDNGYLFLVTPHWPYCAKTFYDSYSHYQPYSHKSMRALLLAHKFEPLALVPWLVKKSRSYWKVPAPLSFWIAKNLLIFPGTWKFAPPFLKGRSTTLLVLARKTG